MLALNSPCTINLRLHKSRANLMCKGKYKFVRNSIKSLRCAHKSVQFI